MQTRAQRDAPGTPRVHNGFAEGCTMANKHVFIRPETCSQPSEDCAQIQYVDPGKRFSCRLLRLSACAHGFVISGHRDPRYFTPAWAPEAIFSLKYVTSTAVFLSNHLFFEGKYQRAQEMSAATPQQRRTWARTHAAIRPGPSSSSSGFPCWKASVPGKRQCRPALRSCHRCGWAHRKPFLRRPTCIMLWCRAVRRGALRHAGEAIRSRFSAKTSNAGAPI